MLTDEQRTLGILAGRDRLAPVRLVRTLVSRRFRTRTPCRRVVFAATLAIGSSPMQSAQWFGAGFWDLVAFTMQMSMIIVTGYAVATAPPVYRGDPEDGGDSEDRPGATAFVALFSMLASLVSWSFSLIFSGLLAREVTHRVRGADYRAVGAAAYLGVGSVWALGLSSSAALIMAAPASLPDAIERISGVIPLSQTLGLWQSLSIAACSSSSRWPSATTRHPAPARPRDGGHGCRRTRRRTTRPASRRQASGSNTAPS